MRHATAANREGYRMAIATEAVRSGSLSLRAASSRYRVAKSTLHEKLRRVESVNTELHTTALMFAEEGVIGHLLVYSNKDVPLTRRYLADGIEILIRTLPVQSQEHLPFKTGMPGVRFLQNFKNWHEPKLQIAGG